MLKRIQFSASLHINTDAIAEHKGTAYAHVLNRVANSFKDDFARLPANINTVNINQEQVRVPAKASPLDFFPPILLMKLFTGGFLGRFVSTPNTQVQIEGIEARGYRRQKTVAVQPQTLPSQKQLGFIKRSPNKAELETLARHFRSFFHCLLAEARNFSTSLSPEPKPQRHKFDIN